MIETAKLPIQEQAVIPETNWDEVFDMAKQFNLPKDPHERAKDIAAMKAEDLIAMTTLLHNQLAPAADMNPTAETMRVMSPEGANPKDMMPPEERYQHFQHAAGLINKLGESLKPGTEIDFLDRAGNIVAASTLLAHPFEDGNGRTARFTSHFIRNGAPESEYEKNDLMYLGNNRAAEGTKEPTFIPHQGEMTPNDYLTAVAAIEVPLDSTPVAYEQATAQLITTPYDPTRQ